ncbi:MAG: hypothetical protein H6708_16560 [Kofleriaceae bacterium]|nr:hypothetical protein [Kofleriaceae bacterium]
MPPRRDVTIALIAAACAGLAVAAVGLACAPQAGPGPGVTDDGGGDVGGGDAGDTPTAPDAATPLDGGAPIDGAPAIDASTAACVHDDDCGAGQGCRSGICRDPCLLGLWCDAATTGSVCQAGYCVECTTDADCDSGRLRCDAATSSCVARPFDPSVATFGIFYSTWHCRAAGANPVHDISRVLAGAQSWASDYQTFYYWGRPAAGYYCPSDDDAVLRQHAELLRDAGIGFVFVDATNHAYVGVASDDTPGMILRPLDRLLAVWSTVPGAPRVVPWVPVVAAGHDPAVYTVDAMLQRLAAYPGMQFTYLGKPLLLITDNAQHPVNAAREAELAATYTVRRMWGVFGDDGPSWSFLQACQQSPTSAEPCDQRVARRAGAIEQIPISAAYQQTYMSIPSATPKHRGLTFRKEFERAFTWPETPIITITGWNEWIAQRQPCGQHPSCPCGTYPDGCFIDQWDVEYSRDVEPAAEGMGDYYYRLMRACISLFRTGDQCDAAHADDLCCRAWTP